MGFALSNVEGKKEDIFTQQTTTTTTTKEKRNAIRIKKGHEGDGAKFPINNGGCVACMRDMPVLALRARGAMAF